MMSKEFAREQIEKYLERTGGVLPIQDVVVFEQGTEYGIQQFTFRYLLCVAYDLETVESSEL